MQILTVLAVVSAAVLWVLAGPAVGPAEAATPDWPDVDDLPSQPELPDPLVMYDGTAVESPQQWHDQRRPELLELFAHYMYGHMPDAPAEVRSERVMRDAGAVGGQATLEVHRLRFDGEPPNGLYLLLAVPNDAAGPVPVFFGLNFGGNHTVIDHPDVPVTEARRRSTEVNRGRASGRWPLELPIERGYAVATLYAGEISPDRDGAFDEGVHAHTLAEGQDRPGPHEWMTIAAWAWGLHRAADYLLSDDRIDPDGLIVIGHSRLGKAALLAGANDERMDIVIPNQAGCGGTSPSRSDVGESVEVINTRFPHWFTDTFKRFNTQVDRLPFDQHGLIAAVAPRPVLLSNAEDDEWADPVGQFEMLRAADPVYRLLGVEGLAESEMPELDRLIDSRLGYFIRAGEHSVTTAEWEAWMAFADRHLGR